MEQILNLLTTLCTKVDSMDGEIQQLKKQASSQQHDVKNAELRRSEDVKIPELEGDVGKLHKTHNVCLNTSAEHRCSKCHGEDNNVPTVQLE
ncbi:hypothetical protein R3W88_033909 [Solanum pinnatisectum]|uniref:Uncharacterized protein n=1 Tax=Solanum pinnatisectum TaxID=50273 RepID=A0AAV9JZM6_9SOLN|nr:hypothetical protein R3W88_033909 [Solanum pinnatisectum]